MRERVGKKTPKKEMDNPSPADKFAKFSPTFANKLRKNGEFAKYLRLYVAKISESLQNRIFCETLRNRE